ncbi:outer membrane protein, partial [Azospirillum sp. B4]|uniref:outer membrane protein n=1 Tax=Azospirillum sp. B4 TaxID=95605 RepID=UPI0011DD6800
MKLRHSLLCAVFALGLPATALAQVDEGYYIGAQAGVNWADKTDLKGSTYTDKADFTTSPTGLVEGGYKFGNGVRLGVEVGYGGSTVGDITGGGPGRAGGAGEVTAFTFMANTYYDFKVDSPLRPYVGVGVGFGRYKFDGVGDLYTPGNIVETSTTAFTYQLSAGVAYALSPNLDFTLGYRFMGTPDTTYEPSNSPKVKGSLQSHSVLVGLRYTFGAP